MLVVSEAQKVSVVNTQTESAPPRPDQVYSRTTSVEVQTGLLGPGDLLNGLPGRNGYCLRLAVESFCQFEACRQVRRRFWNDKTVFISTRRHWVEDWPAARVNS